MKKTCSKGCPPIKVHKRGRRSRCCYSYHLLRGACTMWSFFRQFSSCLFTFLYIGDAHATELRNASGQGKKKKRREHPVKPPVQGVLPGYSFPVNLLHLMPPAVQEPRVRSLGWEDPLKKEMAAHSSILAWKIPWTTEPGRLPSTGSQRVGHN